MTEPSAHATSVPQKNEESDWQDYIAPLVALALTLFFLYESYQLSEKARMVPLLALYANLVFVALDLLARTKTSLGRGLRRTLLANAPPMKILGGYRGAPLSRELGAILVVLLFSAAVQLFGILLVVPFFVTFYMVFWSKKKITTSLMAAIVITGIVFVLFEVILKVSLYKGLLFAD